MAGYAAVGAAIGLGQAPLGWWWASLAGLSVLLAILPRRGPARSVVWRLWLAGCGYFALSLFWIVEPFFIEPDIHGWMAPFALIGMAGGMALFWALAGLGARVAQDGARVLAIAVLLVAAEMLRGVVLTGFPWAMLGHVLIDTPLVHLAALSGAGGLSLLLALSAGLVAFARNAVARLVVGGVVAASLWGIWLWGAAPRDMPAPRDQIARIAQPNAPQDEKWLPGRAMMFFERLLDQTAADPLDASPSLIIWPETAVPFLLDRPGDGLDMILDAARVHGPATQAAIGVQRFEGGRYFNSLAVLAAGSENGVTAVYDKHHLVPFGEYVPLAEAILGAGYAGFAAQQLSGYSAGPGPVVLDLGALGRVLPLICYEVIFPRHMRTDTRPDWILQVTNDAWFGDLTGPYQHLAQARLRAVEQGLPVLRSANTGVSAVIDARGGIVTSLGLNTEGFVDAPIPGALPPTLYARTGDLPLILLLALLLGGAVLISRRSGPEQAAGR